MQTKDKHILTDEEVLDAVVNDSLLFLKYIRRTNVIFTDLFYGSLCNAPWAVCRSGLTLFAYDENVLSLA